MAYYNTLGALLWAKVDADLLVSYVAALYPINPCIIHFIA